MSITFEQDRAFSTEVLVLEDRQLVIQGRLGIKGEQAIWLRDIDPCIHIVKKRFWRYYIFAAIWGGLVIGFMRYIMGEYSDIELLSDIAIVVGVGATSSQLFRPIDVYQVRGKNGSLVVQIYASKRKRFLCADFIRVLSDRMAGNKPPNQAPLPTPASVTPAADAPVAPDAGAAEL